MGEALKRNLAREFRAAPADAGKRLDQFLVEKLESLSRARVRDLIAGGRVRMGDGPSSRSGPALKPGYRMRGSESVAVEWEPPRPLRAYPEDIPLEVLYEDDDLVVVNKQAGMTVHAGAGRTSGTLVNALLHRFGALSGTGGELRPGIVHRLDRQTSGVLLVARSDEAHRSLAAQFQKREVEKTYLALVHGSVKSERGKISAPISRDRVRRRRMTSRRRGGRQALTEYRVLRRLPGYTLLEVILHTGRTHQIRVHLSSLGHAVAGDTLYGAPGGVLARNFLHAARIAFHHPRTGRPLEFSAPLPAELSAFVDSLEGGARRP